MIDTYFRYALCRVANHWYTQELIIFSRKGLYPSPSFPQISGVEASGVIVKLPTDPAVLESKWYQLRDYKVGGRVAVVSIFIPIKLLKSF